MAKLTIDDPISVEVLTKFTQLATHRAALAEQYFDIDAEKVRIMVAVRQIDQEKSKLFEKELLDRGISPTTSIEVDPQTGRINLVGPIPIPTTTEE